MTCLDPGPLGKWALKVICPEGKFTCSRQPDWTLFKPGVLHLNHETTFCERIGFKNFGKKAVAFQSCGVGKLFSLARFCGVYFTREWEVTDRRQRNKGIFNMAAIKRKSTTTKAEKKKHKPGIGQSNPSCMSCNSSLHKHSDHPTRQITWTLHTTRI